jgi:hypothetical protein
MYFEVWGILIYQTNASEIVEPHGMVKWHDEKE